MSERRLRGEPGAAKGLGPGRGWPRSSATKARLSASRPHVRIRAGSWPGSPAARAKDGRQIHHAIRFHSDQHPGAGGKISLVARHRGRGREPRGPKGRRVPAAPPVPRYWRFHVGRRRTGRVLQRGILAIASRHHGRPTAEQNDLPGPTFRQGAGGQPGPRTRPGRSAATRRRPGTAIGHDPCQKGQGRPPVAPADARLLMMPLASASKPGRSMASQRTGSAAVCDGSCRDRATMRLSAAGRWRARRIITCLGGTAPGHWSGD